MRSTRTTLRVLQRRQAVASRYLRGESQATIARALGVTQQQISLDLQAIHALWLAAALRDTDALKAEQRAKIDAVEREAWAAWHRSQQPREMTVTEATDGGETPRRKNSVRREGQAGAPCFLAVILTCVARRCTLLGLDEPQRFLIDWDRLSDEQVERLARGEPPQQVLTKA